MSLRGRRQDEAGITLIELLVVILIIGLLASIGMVVLRGQRQRALVSALQSALKSAATSAEAFNVVNGGTYLNVNLPALKTEGYRTIPRVGITISGSVRGYCILGAHFDLPEAHTWRVASYNSAVGRPTEDDGASCVEPAAPAPPSSQICEYVRVRTCRWFCWGRDRYRWEYRCRTEEF